jgi:hypothetical protein
MASTRIVLCVGALLLGFASHAFAQGNPLRDAYFGETHVHTSWSLDAWTFGNRVTGPDDTYKYFKGEPIKHPLGYDIKIDRGLQSERGQRTAFGALQPRFSLGWFARTECAGGDVTILTLAQKF